MVGGLRIVRHRLPDRKIFFFQSAVGYFTCSRSIGFKSKIFFAVTKRSTVKYGNQCINNLFALSGKTADYKVSGEAVSSGAHKPPSSWEQEMDGERLNGQEIDGESQWEGSRKRGGMETMNGGSLVGSGGSGELWGDVGEVGDVGEGSGLGSVRSIKSTQTLTLKAHVHTQAETNTCATACRQTSPAVS